MPVQVLIPKANAVPGTRRNERPGRGVAAFVGRQVEPSGPDTQRSLEVVQADVDVALDVSAVLGRDIGPGPGQIRGRQLAEPETQIFDAGAVAAHVERVEIVDLDVLAPIEPLTAP